MEPVKKYYETKGKERSRRILDVNYEALREGIRKFFCHYRTWMQKGDTLETEESKEMLHSKLGIITLPEG